MTASTRSECGWRNTSSTAGWSCVSNYASSREDVSSITVNGSARAFKRAELVALMKPGARLVEPASAHVAEEARQP